jgi:hypothetical protein
MSSVVRMWTTQYAVTFKPSGHQDQQNNTVCFLMTCKLDYFINKGHDSYLVVYTRS